MLRLILVGQIGHQLREVVDAVISDAHRARGEAAVAAALGFDRRAFEHQHARPTFARCERRTKSGIATADYDHVVGRSHCGLSFHSIFVDRYQDCPNSYRDSHRLPRTSGGTHALRDRLVERFVIAVADRLVKLRPRLHAIEQRLGTTLAKMHP